VDDLLVATKVVRLAKLELARGGRRTRGRYPHEDTQTLDALLFEQAGKVALRAFGNVDHLRSHKPDTSRLISTILVQFNPMHML
jgi:hypothetical protein